MSKKKNKYNNFDETINEVVKKSISNKVIEEIENEKGYMTEDNNNAAASAFSEGKVNNLRINQSAFGGINTSDRIFPEGEGDPTEWK